MKKPVIGIVANILIMEGGMFPGIHRTYVNHDYVESVEKAGGIAMLLPLTQNLDDIKEMIHRCDGLLLSGGYDMDPLLYGEEPMQQQGFIFKDVDTFYINVLKYAKAIKKPVFGICKGIQAMNIAFGGTLYQDLGVQVKDSYKHVQNTPREIASHNIQVEQTSYLASVLPETVLVNSFHHQAIKDVAPGFTISATAKDGVVEAIENMKDGYMLGVQWHPEMMASHDNKEMLAIFKAFIRTCEKGE